MTNESNVKEAFSRLPSPAPYLVRYFGELGNELIVEVEDEENLHLTNSMMTALLERLVNEKLDVVESCTTKEDGGDTNEHAAFWRNASNEPVRLALAAVLRRDISCKAAAFFVAALAGEGEDQYLNGPSIIALNGLRRLVGRRVIYIANRNPFLAEISSISTNANRSTRITFRNLHAPGLPSVWPYSAPVPDELIAEERLAVFQELVDTESCHGYMGVFEIYSNPAAVEQILRIGSKDGEFQEIRKVLREIRTP